MNLEERAYRKQQWKEREQRKRLNLDEDKRSVVTAVNRVAQRHKSAEDYDKDDLPDDYSMPVAILVPGRLMVGPPCVTKQQKAYVEKKLGNPQLVALELAPQAERKLWKLKESIAWYTNYTKGLAKKEGILYLYHENGCDEEAVVGLVVANILSGGEPFSRNKEEFDAWRQKTGYLWFLDREEESLLPIALGCIDEIKGGGDGDKKGNSSKGLKGWLLKK